VKIPTRTYAVLAISTLNVSVKTMSFSTSIE
jgi:hypothetical protein